MKNLSLKKTYYVICSAVIALLVIYSCDKKIGLLPKPEVTGPNGAPGAGFNCATASYSIDIQPLLTTNCVACHSSSFQDFSNYAGTKVWLDNGKFVFRVLTAKTMPLSSSLSQADYDKIKCWVDNGSLNN